MMTKAESDCYLQSDAFRRGYAADRAGSDAANPFRFDSVEYHDFIAGALVREQGWPKRNTVSARSDLMRTITAGDLPDVNRIR